MQLDTTAVVEPCADGTSMKGPFFTPYSKMIQDRTHKSQSQLSFVVMHLVVKN